MTITFTQSGQTLILTGNPPVQYSDGVPVTVTLDSEYSNATEIVLLTQIPGKNNPARTALTRSGTTASGTINRSMLMQSGITLFVLAGKVGNMYLPTAACLVDVQQSVDPQAQIYMQAPVSIIDLIANATADYLQTDAGRNMLADKLAALATDQGFVVPVLSDSVTSTSSTTAATSKAVKIALDQAKDIRIIPIAGAIANSDGGSMSGLGNAVVTLYPNRIAKVDYSYFVTAPGTKVDVWASGLNRDLLTVCNPDVPRITPMAGGIATEWVLGSDNTHVMSPHNDFGGTHQILRQFWQFSRIYNHDVSIGGYGDSHYQYGMVITGTAYGTY